MNGPYDFEDAPEGEPFTPRERRRGAILWGAFFVAALAFVALYEWWVRR